MSTTTAVQLTEARIKWEERYASGPTPWDTGITPPEVEAFWASGRLDPGKMADRLALDLGCGTGTNSAYLAGLGLRVMGFDLSFTAIQRGQQRRTEIAAPLPQHALLSQASVDCLPVPTGSVGYVLDVGCLHALSVEIRFDYAKELIRVLAPGGFYQLYAFDWEDTAENPRRWLASHEAERLFAKDLEFVEITVAEPAPHPCKWYLLQKPT